MMAGMAEVAALTGIDISPGMEKFCKIESPHLEWNYRYWQARYILTFPAGFGKQKWNFSQYIFLIERKLTL